MTNKLCFWDILQKSVFKVNPVIRLKFSWLISRRPSHENGISVSPFPTQLDEHNRRKTFGETYIDYKAKATQM